jgi:oligoendopeptidase F
MSSQSQPRSAAGVTWDLSALFASPDDPAINRTVKSLTREVAAFSKRYRGKIKAGVGAATLLAGLQEYERLQDTATRLSVYAHLIYAADTTQDKHRALLGRIDDIQTRLHNQVLFFDLDWVGLPEASAKKLLADPKLKAYRHYLAGERKYKPHTLSEPEEQIANEKSMTGISAWQKLHTEFASGLRYSVEVDGVVREFNQGEVLSVLLRQPDRALRERAWRAFFSTLENNGQVLSYIYDTRFHDHIVNNRLRGYKDPAQPRHLANGIDVKAVNAMMTVVERNFPLAHRYWALKSRLLGLEHLELYDQYAPLYDVKDKVPYSAARGIVLDALQRFSPEYAALAARFFDNNWIDAEPRNGKRGGAFCSGVTPGLHPVILMSYNDDIRDVMTLAHELGHGMHDLLASRQSLFNYQPSLPVAETASVFAEMLVFDDMRQKLTSDRERLALVCGKIEDSFSTVFRQTVMTRFEQLAYAARAQGRLSGKQIGDLWLRANEPYYGSGVHMTKGYAWGWSYVPHFMNTPFYCYAYSFGDLLVKALYGMYRRDGEAFIPKYTALLASGGSRSPREQTRALGVDINSEAFWQIGFDELERLVAEAERLAVVTAT